MFVSYNTYPGCHVRRAAWEIMHLHIDAIEGAAAQLDAARVLCKALGEPAMTQIDSDAALRGEFLRLARQSDSALCHDDLAQPNDPVYFRDFVAHAERHGLEFLAEAKLSMMSDAGVAPGVRQLLAGFDRVTREQYLDFARLRRFRSSLLCHPHTGTDFALRSDRLANMWVCASSGVVRAAAEGRLAQVTAATSPGVPDPNEAADAEALLRWLVEIFPRTAPVVEVREWHRHCLEKHPRDAPPPRSVEALLLEACISGVVEAHVWMAALVGDAGERPLASPVARWQARNGERITNLRHETLTFKDVSARRLLALLDGTRTREVLAEAWAEALAEDLPGDALVAGADLDDCLKQFAKHALLLR
jgi:Predicted methyltransferase regulatory domain